MERYNPFASHNLAQDERDDDYDDLMDDELRAELELEPNSPAAPRGAQSMDSPKPYQSGINSSEAQSATADCDANKPSLASYSTSFPDPFDASHPLGGVPSVAPPPPPSSSRSVDDGASLSQSPRGHERGVSGRPRPVRQASGAAFTSFLSRATSVTSSSVSGAVGSVKSAVDSLSSQIQSAVPSNLNERLSTTATSLMGATADQLSSATKLSSPSNPNQAPKRLVSRQRVVLILDNPSHCDWTQQFVQHQRLVASIAASTPSGVSVGGATSGSAPLTPGAQSSSVLSSLFSTATAPFSSNSSTMGADMGDLFEQVDFRDGSVFANQASSTALVSVTGCERPVAPRPASGGLTLASKVSSKVSSTMSMSSSQQASAVTAPRTVRPEYVIVRQQAHDQQDQQHLVSLVKALSYSAIPMFEPWQVWSQFQDRQLVFANLLAIQRTLGKQKFPLIPQVYCQTHTNLLNYIQTTSTMSLPCLVRVGTRGKGKIRMDNLQMLRDFATVTASTNSSCTIEPHLDVKCDLIVQRIGLSSLKLYRRNTSMLASRQQHQQQQQAHHHRSFEVDSVAVSPTRHAHVSSHHHRQTSLGGNVLASLVSLDGGSSASNRRASSSQQQQSGDSYERLSEVSARYRSWADAIWRHFDGRLQAFALKIVVTQADREYIVGLENGSMGFLGSSPNQDEDRREFVELVLNSMDTVIGEHVSFGSGEAPDSGAQPQSLPARGRPVTRQQGAQLGGRSQSVSVNSDSFEDNSRELELHSSPEPGFRRGLSNEGRGSFERLNDSSEMSNSDANLNNLGQRQASIGQSIFDQTSTAFNSFQRQSYNFFKRLDGVRSGASDLPTQTVGATNTPPHSAKSERIFGLSDGVGSVNSPGGGAQQSSVGVNRKSQSVDVDYSRGFNSGSGSSASFHFDTENDIDSFRQNRRLIGGPKPAVPPPPQMGARPLAPRQSSMVNTPTSYTHSRAGVTATPHSTPTSTRQNSFVDGQQQVSTSRSSSSNVDRTRVLRQNSALSAFEPYDQALASSQATGTDEQVHSPAQASKRAQGADAISTTSAESNTTSTSGETATAEDTMKNLKKTFASIFGDKCE